MNLDVDLARPNMPQSAHSDEMNAPQIVTQSGRLDTVLMDVILIGIVGCGYFICHYATFRLNHN